MAKYPDLKSYLQVNHLDVLKRAIQEFVDKSYDGSGFHSINVLSLRRHEIENPIVKALTCHDDIGPRVKMDVGVEADIVQLGIGTKRYESDRKKRWFTVFLRGNLIDGLKDVEVLDTQEYYVIDRSSYEKLYHNNSDFAELIDSGKMKGYGTASMSSQPSRRPGLRKSAGGTLCGFAGHSVQRKQCSR